MMFDDHGDWEKWLKTGGKQMPLLSSKRTRRKTGSYRLVSLTSILRKMMEQLILKIISGHVKDKKVLRNSQHEFTKKKICLINLLLFNDDWLGI